ncbi:MAG: hypothetical protein K9J06_12815 [Flavobacteriales bacterium]|nr:hypothetical protein [Flavobacteriales bacterium]
MSFHRTLRPLLAIVLLLATLGVSGCKEDMGGSTWDVDLLTPIANVRLTMAQLLTDSLVQEDADGRMRLKFETDLIGLEIDSIVRIPDTTITTPISFTQPVTNLPPGSQFIPFITFTKFNLGGIALQRVRMREGRVRVVIRSELGTPVNFNYQLPLAYLWGTPFSYSTRVEAGSAATPSEVEFTFDLRGYEMDLRTGTQTQVNTIEGRYIIETAADGVPVSMAANVPFFFIDLYFEGLVPDYGRGFFGQQGETVEEELKDMDVLSSITDGALLLDSVTIDLSIINGVGADAAFRMGHLRSVNTRTGSTIDLQHSLVGSTQNLSRAIDHNGTAEGVQTSQLSFRLDNATSNIKALLENLPDRLDFAFDFNLNPLGNVSLGNDFFYYDRPFEAKIAVNIPLRASMQNLTLVDTLEWDLADNEAVESINHGTFLLIAKNGFPLQGKIELVLLDADHQSVGTLIEELTVPSPALDADRKVTAPLESRHTIPVPDALADQVTLAKFARLKVTFDSPLQPDLIDIYAHYGIDIKLIADINVNLGGNGN